MKFFYVLTYILLWLPCHILYPLFVTGRRNIPKGACIVCANHSNYVDPLLIIYAFGLKHFLNTMSKKQNMEKPVLGWIYKMCGGYSVDREGQDIHAVRQTLNLLKSGEKVVIFPEGTRTALNDPDAGKLGAVRFASKLRVPLLPVFVTRNKKPFHKVHIHIGKPYAVSGNSQAEYIELTRSLLLNIFALGEPA